jgi:hypothetical protein
MEEKGKYETNAVDLSPRFQPVQLKSVIYRKLKILADEQSRSMSNMVEILVEKAWNETHPQPITVEEQIERR